MLSYENKGNKIDGTYFIMLEEILNAYEVGKIKKRLQENVSWVQTKKIIKQMNKQIIKVEKLVNNRFQPFLTGY